MVFRETLWSPPWSIGYQRKNAIGQTKMELLITATNQPFSMAFWDFYYWLNKANVLTAAVHDIVILFHF